MIDTRDLADKREELQTDLVDSFNNYFDTEVEDFDELVKHIDDSENEDVQEWRDDNSDDFEHIEEIDELEDEISEFFNGETLILEDDFTECCIDMVEDCYNLPGFVKDNIDWNGVASDLSVDYTNVKYQGESYLVRAY